MHASADRDLLIRRHRFSVTTRGGIFEAVRRQSDFAAATVRDGHFEMPAIFREVPRDFDRALGSWDRALGPLEVTERRADRDDFKPRRLWADA